MTAQKKNAKKRNRARKTGSASAPLSPGNISSGSEAREWTADEMANAKPLPLPTTEATFLPAKTPSIGRTSAGGKPRE